MQKCRNAEFPECRNAVMQISRNADFPECRVPGMQKCRNAEFPECRDPGMQDSRNAEFPECRVPGMQKCRNAEFPECRDPGMQDSRNAEFRECRVPGMQISIPSAKCLAAKFGACPSSSAEIASDETRSNSGPRGLPRFVAVGRHLQMSGESTVTQKKNMR